MRKLLTFLVCFCICTFSKAQQKNDWEKDCLKGRVKTVKRSHTIDSYSIDGYKIKEEWSYKKSYSCKHYYYNDNNKLVRMRQTDTGEILIDDMILKNYSTYYKYDDQGRLIEEQTIVDNDLNFSKAKYIYKYIGAILVKTYDGFSDSDKEIHYYNSKNQDTFIIYQYSLVRRVFDSFGNHIYSYTFDRSGKLTGEHYFIYNEHNDMIEEGTYINQNGSVKKIALSQYSYIYDEQGNWVQRTHTDWGSPSRTIEYYP